MNLINLPMDTSAVFRKLSTGAGDDDENADDNTSAKGSKHSLKKEVQDQLQAFGIMNSTDRGEVLHVLQGSTAQGFLGPGFQDASSVVKHYVPDSPQW